MRLNQHWVVYSGILLAAFILAANFPITIDEAYYIAFSKNLQLSYVDHPPFVSYLNLAQSMFGLTSPLFNRLLVIMTHLIATLFLLAIVYNHCEKDEDLATKLLVTFLIAYVVPIFGMYSIIILPDTGLILSLSMMLWAADKVVLANELSWRNAFELGIGLGIGMLAKYHILPLGGGILFGVLLDLSLRSTFMWSNLAKLVASLAIGLMCALPVFIWNWDNHFASFMFQLQHGFRSDTLHPMAILSFIYGSVFYLTPWFAFILLKQGLFSKKHWHLLIPVCSLVIILLISSARKHVLSHWVSPAFWLLIPYAVIYSSHRKRYLSLLMKMCKYTALLWLVFIAVMLLPAERLAIKQIGKIPHVNPIIFVGSSFWEELPEMIQKNAVLADIVDKALHQKPNSGCAKKNPIVGTYRWFWASQLEYHQMFPGAQILNLELNSSNFYLWRDDWSDYANCNILLIGEETQNITSELAQILKVNHEYTLHGLGDYPALNLKVISATLDDSNTIKNVQQSLLAHPHY